MTRQFSPNMKPQTRKESADCAEYTMNDDRISKKIGRARKNLDLLGRAFIFVAVVATVALLFFKDDAGNVYESIYVLASKVHILIAMATMLLSCVMIAFVLVQNWSRISAMFRDLLRDFDNLK